MEEKTMLSQGEWRIMNLLWKKKNRTIMEMVEDFAGVTDWDKHTLIVMLKRMEAKGVVAYETVGRAKHYYPVGKQADFVMVDHDLLSVLPKELLDTNVCMTAVQGEITYRA